MIVAAVLVLILGIGAYVYGRQRNKSTDITQQQTVNTALSPAAQFAQAVAGGKPTVCTVSKDSDTMKYFVKGNVMRADITTSAGISHMINDSQYIYIWADGQTQGMKTAIPSQEEIAKLKDQADKYQGGAPNLTDESDYQSMLDSGYDISCQEGEVKDTDLTPPDTITFQDISSMMQAVPSSTPGTTESVDYTKMQEYGQGQIAE